MPVRRIIVGVEVDAPGTERGVVICVDGVTPIGCHVRGRHRVKLFNETTVAAYHGIARAPRACLAEQFAGNIAHAERLVRVRLIVEAYFAAKVGTAVSARVVYGGAPRGARPHGSSG